MPTQTQQYEVLADRLMAGSKLQHDKKQHGGNRSSLNNTQNSNLNETLRAVQNSSKLKQNKKQGKSVVKKTNMQVNSLQQTGIINIQGAQSQ